MKNFWLSWWATPENGAFELETPWWRSGARFEYRPGEEECVEVSSIVAAVCAEDEKAAIELIYAAHDARPANIEFRFCNERADDWTPFASDRWPRADWMKWPRLVT